jgi:anti-sigma B factor antagonist
VDGSAGTFTATVVDRFVVAGGSVEPVPLVTRVEVDAEGQAVVYVEGDIDLATANALREALVKALEKSATVVVDVGGAGFIDSTGLNAFVRGHREAEQAGGSLRLRRPSPMLRRLLEITALESVLLIDDDAPPPPAPEMV